MTVNAMKREASIIFGRDHPETKILGCAYIGPMTHGYHGINLTVRLPSGVTGLYTQAVHP